VKGILEDLAGKTIGSGFGEGNESQQKKSDIPPEITSLRIKYVKHIKKTQIKIHKNESNVTLSTMSISLPQAR